MAATPRNEADVKALFYTATEETAYRDAPEPAPAVQDALVRVDAVGICGSDMHAWHGREMPEHIDLDCSGILRGEMTLDEAGDALMEITLRTCNGRLTAAESLKHREFVMTKLYRSA